MKTLLAIIALISSSFAFAQKSTSVSQSISDNGKKLSIKINGTVDGKMIDYDRTFDVSSLSKSEREALKDRVLDSLGINIVPPALPAEPAELTLTAPVPAVAPVVVKAPAAPRAPVAVAAPAPAVASVSVGAPVPPVAPVEPFEAGVPVVSSVSKYAESYVVGGKNPYTKEIRYSPESGKLYMRYRFTKNGEEKTYEKSIEAKDKSMDERKQIIQAYEKEIGLLKSATL